MEDVSITDRVDELVENFTELLLYARNETVPMVRPNFEIIEISTEIKQLKSS